MTFFPVRACSISAAPQTAALTRNLTITLTSLNENAYGTCMLENVYLEPSKMKGTSCCGICKTIYRNSSNLLLFGKRKL